MEYSIYIKKKNSFRLNPIVSCNHPKVLVAVLPRWMFPCFSVCSRWQVSPRRSCGYRGMSDPVLTFSSHAGCSHAALVCFMCNGKDECDDGRNNMWFDVCTESNTPENKTTYCVAVRDEDGECWFPQVSLLLSRIPYSQEARKKSISARSSD